MKYDDAIKLFNSDEVYKRKCEIRLGFCDQAGNPVSQSDATHIGWSLS